MSDCVERQVKIAESLDRDIGFSDDVDQGFSDSFLFLFARIQAETGGEASRGVPTEYAGQII